MAKKTTTKKEVKANESLKLKMSYAQINLELQPAVKIIGEGLGIKDVDTTMSIVKTRKNIDSLMKDFQETRKKLVEDLAEKHEDGKPVTRKTVQRHPLTGIEQEVQILVYKDEDTNRLANSKAQELDEKEVEIEIFPIEYKHIKNLEIGDKKGVPPNVIVAGGEFIIM